MKTRKLSSGGFSILEVLVTGAIIGVAAALAVQGVGEGSEALVESDLAKEVRSLNQAVDLYKVFGGSMEGANTPQEVLRRLQLRADATGREQVAGLTGNLIDKRLRVELLPEAAARTDKPRALWDSGNERFILTTEEHDPELVAVASFQIKSGPENVYVPVNGGTQSESEQGAGEESRDPNLKLALGNGWIWDYNESSAVTGSGPTQILTPGGGGGGFGGVVDPNEGEPSVGAGGSSAQALDPPLFSVAAGAYLITSYHLELTLADPNPPGVSRIIYHVSGSPWSVYGGETISVAPNTTVTAFVESVEPGTWSNSEVQGNFYGVVNVQLEEPIIETSEEDFGEIEIENGN